MIACANNVCASLRPDEVGAIVMEVGASEFLAGYAGEDVPSCIFPSTAGFIPGQPETDAVCNRLPIFHCAECH